MEKDVDVEFCEGVCDTPDQATNHLHHTENQFFRARLCDEQGAVWDPELWQEAYIKMVGLGSGFHLVEW